MHSTSVLPDPSYRMRIHIAKFIEGICQYILKPITISSLLIAGIFIYISGQLEHGFNPVLPYP